MQRWLVASVALLALLWWFYPRGTADDKAGSPTIERTQPVERRAFNVSAGFVGSIVPGEGEPIVAPFDGAVQRIDFVYGDRINPGQPLLVLDRSELDQVRNEAQANYLKAAQVAADMNNWESSSDVLSARRSAALAGYDLQETERKIAETKALLDRGLVPRGEYDGLIQQRRSQQYAAAGANENLSNALKRGRGTDREVAILALANARTRLEEVNRQAENAVVRAPVEGVIVRPPQGKADAGDGAVHAGTRLTRGQLIGSIARSGNLAVSFNIDESDVVKLKVDQPVTVSGAGFPGLVLNGKITSIASEASNANAAGSGKASFTAIVRLDQLAPEQAARVRIGMSANISVISYTNPSAIVVPPQAVRGTAPDVTVMVRDTPGGKARAVKVQIGQVAPDGVEILSGLKPGQILVWREPAPPPAPAM